MASARTLRPIAALAIAVVAALPAAPRAHEPDANEIALGSLVDAELAFAKMAAERGVRAAFLANFAADGIAFEPKPIRLRETWSARPAPADPLALRLEWSPAQAAVARSFDLGYTTGPYTLWNAATPERKRHGVFFSVWRRAAKGRWEVVLDAGIGTPGNVDFAALGEAPRSQSRARGTSRRDLRKSLLAYEAGVAGGDGLTPAGYARVIADDVRLHRDGAPPRASRAVVAREMALRMARVTWSPIDAQVSAAGDIGVTYGRARETDRASVVHENYYAHLWVRDAERRWRLAYDIALGGE